MRLRYLLVPVAVSVTLACFPSGATCQGPDLSGLSPGTEVDPDGGGTSGYDNDGGFDDDGGLGLPTGDIAWSVPGGAVTTPIVVTATPLPNAPAVPNAVVVGTPYEMSPEGQAFLEPVTLDLPFNPAKIPSGKTESDVVVYTAPLGSAAYTRITGTVVGRSHIRVEVNHFSVFVAAVPE